MASILVAVLRSKPLVLEESCCHIRSRTLPLEQLARCKQEAQEASDPRSRGRELRSDLCWKSRKAVKLRTVEDGKHYTAINGGQPISVAQWLAMACSTFDPATVGKAIKDSPIIGVEAQP